MFPSAMSLVKASQELNLSSSYDNSLFFTLLLTGFHGLMRLGEITWPDKTNLQDYRKVIMRNSVHIDPKSFQFVLPGHKADCFFEGSLVIIQSTDLANDPYQPFISYLSQCNHRFPLRPQRVLYTPPHNLSRSEWNGWTGRNLVGMTCQ